MSVVTPIKEEKLKVHRSDYISGDDKPAEETKPAEESKPTAVSDADDQAKPVEPAKIDSPA